MKYIDIHCHLDFPDYGEELPQILERMKENEVGAITIGTDFQSSKRAVEIANQNENIWACIGVDPAPSPLEGEGWGEAEKEFEKLASNPKVVAIGECGLDFFRTKPEDLEMEKERQTQLFETQIKFALKYDKPLMLHCRNAYDEVLDILKSYKREAGDKLRGNVHFFAGTVEQARKFFDLGFTISFTGVITFTRDYDEVIKFAPKGKIMSETDAPFVAPEPHRGKRNEPIYVIEVVKKMAKIREVSEDDMRKMLLETAEKTFAISLQN